MKQKRMQIIGKKYDDTNITKFRKHWLKKGYELIDVTQLIDLKLGISGWCNDFNEPDEQIYHIKVIYRGEEICSFPDPNTNCDENYIVFTTNEKDISGADFIIFRKLKK